MLRETHKVVYWVPDEGWHLARGILDALNPRRNGAPRSAATHESRHRKALARWLSGQMLSWPIVVLVCGGSAVLTDAQLAKAQALQRDCELGVCVCAALSEQERKAHRARKKSAKVLKKPCPLISERLLATGFMVEYYHRGIEPTLARRARGSGPRRSRRGTRSR